MKLTKKIGFYVASTAMRLCLFLAISLGVASIVFGNTAYIKKTLVDSNSYERLVPAIIEANIKEEQTKDSIPFNDKNIQQIIISSFPPSDLQDKSETVIDAFYNWLSGQTAALEFEIDFSENKMKMAKDLSAYTFFQLQGLEACDIQPEVIDPFYAVCRPVNMDYAAEQASLTKQIYESEAFLKSPAISQDDLIKDENGHTVINRFSYAPDLYQWLKKLPWLFIAITIISAGSYILLSHRKREGIASVGYAIIGSSLSLVALTYIFGFIIPHYLKGFDLGLGGGGVQAIVDDAISLLTKEYDTLVINIGLQVSAVGILVVFFEKMTRPATRYEEVQTKSGLISSVKPKAEISLKPNRKKEVPILTSENDEANNKRQIDKKYRKIPKGDF